MMSKWETAIFDDVLTIINGKNQRNVENPNGRYPIYGSGGVMGYADNYLCEKDTVIIGRKGTINSPIYVDEPFWNVDTAFGLRPDEKKLFPKYLYYFCERFDFEALNTTVTIPSLTKVNLLKIEMPLPPLTVQQKIADILDRAVAVIETRKAQIARLDLFVKSQFVKMFGDPVTNPTGWEYKRLGDIVKVTSSKRVYQRELTLNGIPFLRVSDLVSRIVDGVDICDLYISEKLYDDFLKSGFVPKEGDVLVTSRGTLGLCYVVKGEDRFYFQDGMISWLNKQEQGIDSTYLSFLFQTDSIRQQIEQVSAGSTVNYLSIASLGSFKILFPPLDLQSRFAEFVRTVDESKSEMKRGLDKLELLYKSLMQKCFSGELFND
jgi:type I restriction enzyme S subunit